MGLGIKTGEKKKTGQKRGEKKDQKNKHNGHFAKDP